MTTIGHVFIPLDRKHDGTMRRTRRILRACRFRSHYGNRSNNVFPSASRS